MKTNLKIFCGISIFAIIAVVNIAHAATMSVVSNKTSQFNDVLSEMGASTTDSSNAALAETIRRQRALLDAAGDTGATATGGTNITTANACDAALRKCMSEKCGADFTKCASDSTTVWGNKMDACRRNTKCTGHEYTLLAPEILADRNAAIELSYYNSVVNCGNRYNNCVFGICGKSLENCLSKSAGDSAIAKCKSIADECREQDSGLAARVMGVFGDRRNIAATEAQRDEKRLYELRDLMRTQCTRFGAMFDERTLDCVYTVNFFAGTDNTLMASKKLYSGDTFQCTPDWFGVDITTYMENAQRLTRSQTSASAAAMGAGLGTAASLWTSGAVTRAIDTQNAEKQAKEACTAVDGEWVSAGFNQGSKCDMRKPKADCERQGYIWNDEKGCLDKNGQPIGLSNGGSNPGETPETDVDPNALTLTTENPQKIGKPCGNENAGTWISCNDAFCGKECYDNKKDEQVSCACVQTDCLKNGKLRNYYTILDDTGEPAPFANIKCDGMSTVQAQDPEYAGALGSHATNFDGNFCLEENIRNNAKCSIACIGLDPMVGTMKELKEALKKNGNKLIMCSGAINLTKTYKFGESCSNNNSSAGNTKQNTSTAKEQTTENSKKTSESHEYMYTKNGQDINSDENTEDDTYNSSGHMMSTKPNNTQQSNGSHANSSKASSECKDFCNDFIPSDDIITRNEKGFLKQANHPKIECGCKEKIQEKCNELLRTIKFSDGIEYIITDIQANLHTQQKTYGCFEVFDTKEGIAQEEKNRREYEEQQKNKKAINERKKQSDERRELENQCKNTCFDLGNKLIKNQRKGVTLTNSKCEPVCTEILSNNYCNNNTKLNVTKQTNNIIYQCRESNACSKAISDGKASKTQAYTYKTKPCKNKDVNPGDWIVTVENTTMRGISACSSLPGNKNTPATNQQKVSSEYTSKKTNNTAGGNCYCQMQQPNKSKWIFNYQYTKEECPDRCADLCAHHIDVEDEFRQTFLSNIQ